ncbi:hypothetical protein GF406_26280 [candidate division KSB1 bacterium]|nr:hypothetical protein [candidate division KSB1 bacterium]
MPSRKRILHIAPINTSNVPGSFVQAERRLGFDSRLVTLFRDPRHYFQDICLDLPFIDFAPTRWIKKMVSSPQRLTVDNILRIPKEIPRVWKPHSRQERLLVNLRDRWWRPRIEKAIQKYDLDRFDIIQLDGGLGLYRNSSFVLDMHRAGKTILCCYTGSDLRTRGVIPAIDSVSQANFSVEFDHLYLHPRIEHVFFPFDATLFEIKRSSHCKEDPVIIGHAPTNWFAKGSHMIVPVVNQLEKEYNLKFSLIENLPHKEALRRKAECDIFIDQIGDLGYGINSLESLAMGIVTCSCLAPGFADQYPDHPFVEINEHNLRDQLLGLIEDTHKRNDLGEYGASWVRRVHDAENSVKKIHAKIGLDGPE